jgi:hypothetical protein
VFMIERQTPHNTGLSIGLLKAYTARGTYVGAGGCPVSTPPHRIKVDES